MAQTRHLYFFLVLLELLFIDIYPCSDLVRSHWSPEEDQLLIREARLHNYQMWSEVAKRIPGRDGKQCAERYRNHLDPTIDKSPLSDEEMTMLKTVAETYTQNGSAICWTSIANEFFTKKDTTGNITLKRTDLKLRNKWNSIKSRKARKAGVWKDKRKEKIIRNLEFSPIAPISLTEEKTKHSAGKNSKKQRLHHEEQHREQAEYFSDSDIEKDLFEKQQHLAEGFYEDTSLSFSHEFTLAGFPINLEKSSSSSSGTEQNGKRDIFQELLDKMDEEDTSLSFSHEFTLAGFPINLGKSSSSSSGIEQNGKRDTFQELLDEMDEDEDFQELMRFLEKDANTA